MTFRGSDFSGPRHTWGSVPGTPQTAGGSDQWNSMRVRGPRTAGSPEAGVRRGEWQWRGHGPDSASNYAWEYRGGVGRDTTVMRTGAGMGPRGSYEPRLAEERSGGLPRGRERYDADRMWDRMGADRSRGTGWTPRSGGYDRDYGGDRQPLAGSFDRVRREGQDPRWRGDSQRIRQELGRFGDPARGFGQATAWNRYWNEERGSGREVGRGRDDGFRPRSYF